MIDPLPTNPPSKADPVNFDARADALFGALPTAILQFNVTAAEVEAAKNIAVNAAAGTVAAQGYADTATTKAAQAAASASAAASSASAAQAAASQAQAIAGGGVTSVNGAGGAITLNWGNLPGKPTTVAGLGLSDFAASVLNTMYRPQVHCITASTQMASNSDAIIFYGAPAAVLLPPNPISSEVCRIFPRNGRADNVVNPGTRAINGVFGSQVLDHGRAGISFFYISDDHGWEIF